MARLNQDVSAVEADQRSFDPVPAGTYMAKIVESDVVPTKSGDGEMLKMTFEICDGQYQGRKFWDQPCVRHSNPMTQTIAQQRLKAICDAIGHSGNVDDSEELHDQPMMVRVAIEQKDANYAPKNVVKAVNPVQSPTPASKPAANASTARTTNNGGTSATKPAAGKPWGSRQAAAAPR